jgi:hypothetical protein
MAASGAVNSHEAQNLPLESKPALTSIGATSSLGAPPDPDDPGLGGGFDQVSYFRNRYIPDLEDCTDRIAAVFTDWAKARALMLPRKEVTLGSIVMHATTAELKGIFELVYRIRNGGESARVTVFYFAKDGSRFDPVSVKELLEVWSIADLQDELDGAIACQDS